MQYIRALLHYFTLTINEEKDTKWKIQTTFLSFLTRSKLNILPPPHFKVDQPLRAE